MITIYCDFHRLLPIGPSAYVARELQDYVPLRQYLRQILDREDGYCAVYVHSLVLAGWLKDLRDYAPEIIQWVEMSVQTQFERQFGFAPPGDLDDTALQDLLQTLPPTKGLHIEDTVGWILSQCVDPVWECSQPSGNHFVKLAAWIVKNQQIPVFLQPMMKTRMTEWAQYDARYRLFLESPWKSAAERIFLRWALRSYPPSFSLRQELEAVPLEDCSQYVANCLELLKSYNQPLRQFWHSWQTSRDSARIDSILQWSSGLSDVELDAVEQWAHAHQQQLTEHSLRQIKERFSLLPRIESVLKRLERLIPPPLPEPPLHEWSIEKWLDWATNRYMPYFAWTIRTHQPRQVQIERATQFENWLIGIYPRLPFDPEAPFVSHQWGRMKELFDKNEVDVVLWFIIDGLTWWQGERFVEVCAQFDIKGVSMQPMIAALPTITAISKKALVRGSLDTSDSTQPVTQILKTRSTRAMHQVQVYTEVNELEHAFSSSLSPGLYAFLYNLLDHQVHDVQGFTDNESIDGHLKLIARLVKEGFERCRGQGLRVRAFINSDHGSTLLPAKTGVLSLPAFASMLDDDFTEEGEGAIGERRMRFCTTESVPDAYELQSIEKDWHYLHKDVFVLPKQYFLPRGYKAVERRPKGWTHGGATPEEVIVPSIELQPEEIEFIEPLLEIAGNLFPRKVSVLQVTLGNANTFPIRILRLVIADTPAQIARDVAPNASIAGQVEVQPTNSKGNVQSVQWMLTCEGEGTRKSFTGHKDIAVRHMQVSHVDEMFEDM